MNSQMPADQWGYGSRMMPQPIELICDDLLRAAPSQETVVLTFVMRLEQLARLEPAAGLRKPSRRGPLKFCEAIADSRTRYNWRKIAQADAEAYLALATEHGRAPTWQEREDEIKRRGIASPVAETLRKKLPKIP